MSGACKGFRDSLAWWYEAHVIREDRLAAPSVSYASAGCKATGSTTLRYFRCRFPNEYTALANKISRPRNIYRREDAFDAQVTGWLATAPPPATRKRPSTT